MSGDQPGVCRDVSLPCELVLGVSRYEAVRDEKEDVEIQADNYIMRGMKVMLS